MHSDLYSTLSRIDRKTLLLTLHNKANNFSISSIESINKALDQVESDSSIKTLITTGTGKFYSTGLDLKFIANSPRKITDRFLPDHYHPLLKRVLTMPCWTVAAVNGYSIAAGMTFALAHDYVLVQKNFGWMCMNEIDLPSPMPAGMSAILRCKLLDPSLLRDVLLSGKKLRNGAFIYGEPTENVVDSSASLAETLEEKCGKTMRSIKSELYYEVIDRLNLKDSVPLYDIVRGKL